MSSSPSKTMTCICCGQSQQAEQFSKKQRRKSDPTCKTCVEKAVMVKGSSKKNVDTSDSQGGLNIAYAKACSDPISFDDVFNELQDYKRENNSLTIPPDHPSFSKIVDALAAVDMDSVILKRWLQRLAIVQSLDLGVTDNESPYRQNKSANSYPPINNPDIGKWIQTQLDHFSLHTTGLPNPLLGEQVRRLREIGIQSLLKLRSAAEKQASVPSTSSLEMNTDETVKEAAVHTDHVLGTSIKTNLDVDFGNANSFEEAVNDESGAKQRDAANDTPGASLAVAKEEMSDGDNTRQSASADSTKLPGIETKGKCDVCRQKHGHQGQNLRQCRECKVKVHETCYGLMATNTTHPDWVCYACEAVGKQIEVNKNSKIGGPGKEKGREFMTQHKRATECVLCSFDDGSMHAMHPLMDTHGEEGRQLVLPKSSKGEKRLAWVHTLCATFICVNRMTAGCVYGLDQNNNFEDGVENDEAVDSEEEESDNDQSENKSSSEGSYHDDQEDTDRGSSDTEESTTLSCLRAYTIAHGKENKSWTKVINEARQSKCYICGEEDKKKSSLRIPVQCIVDDEYPEYELSEYRKWRKNKQHTQPEFIEEHVQKCTVAMHVGCARWMADLEKVLGKTCHQVHFYPGMNQADDDGDHWKDPVANCYCTAHAREVVVGNPKNAVKTDSTQSQPPEKRNVMAQKKRASSALSSDDEPQKRARRVPGPKKSTATQKKIDSKQPSVFGRREPGITLSDVIEEDFAVLGKAGKALSRRPTENSSKITQNQRAKERNVLVPSVANASKPSESSLPSTHNRLNDQKQVKKENDSSGFVGPTAWKSIGPPNILKGLLTKVSRRDGSQVPAAAIRNKQKSTAITFTRPAQFTTKVFTPTDTASTMQSTDQSAFMACASLAKAPTKKPVGILKNKKPGPIAGAQLAQEAIPESENLNDATPPSPAAGKEARQTKQEENSD